MADSNNVYSRALEIVNRYYQKVVEQMAQEICEREESIVEGGFGWTEIEDRYANRFFNISQIYCNLKKFTSPSEEEEEEESSSVSPPGVEANRLSVEERTCEPGSVRQTIEAWLEENSEAVLWSIQLQNGGAGQTTCLFLYTR